MTDLAIDLKHVAKIYRGRVHALQGVEMHVRRGEIFGLLGPNGAGKSTLVKIMMTVVRPTRAEGTVLGQPVGHKGTLARVGYLPENHRFPKYLTGRQTLEFFGAMSKVNRPTAQRRAGELLETVSMKDWADRKIATYSKGMMQRIGLAQALMNDPDLVLLDEPTDGVDPLGRREILDVMGRLRDQGKTVFINSHALSELESICDRVAILVKGMVAMQGTIDELTVAKQRYEIEVVWEGPDIRQKILTAVPANWKQGETIAPPPVRIPPPPPGVGVPAMPGSVPLPYASPNYANRVPAARIIDRGTLAGGNWIELDLPVLRIGVNNPDEIQPIIDALRSQSLAIRRIQPMRVSLEDLFLATVTDPVSGAPVVAGSTSGKSQDQRGSEVIQTLALLIDAYRDLNSRKLFWITLILSGAVVIIFGLVGVNGPNLTLAGLHFNVAPMPALIVYKLIFSIGVIGIWLTWVAIVLALISTAGIFPELITGGTIDLYLSKPLSRLRLFLTKYFTGLLFVTLQVTVFAAASFVVFGFRAHQWQASIFLAVPIVVCMFSYLFGICVLLGVWTRSTIAAILLTVLCWFGCWGVQKADAALMAFDVIYQKQLERDKATIARADAEMGRMKMIDMFSYKRFSLAKQKKDASERLPELEVNAARFHMWHRISRGIKTAVPKTTETTNLLDRWLFTDEETGETREARSQRRAQFAQNNDSNSSSPFSSNDDSMQEAQADIQNEVRSTSVSYIVGTSLAVEAIFVAFAAWIFCRRDY